ncbi:MAG: prolipoprotein diacylglyceryl transferase [Desulfobacteraceae bacterium]|jgi:phosphatidylglycerol:prolipoprotein diacylglycerol transferase
MFPDLFSIGPLTVHTYGFFVAVGFTAALLLTIKIGKAEGMKAQQVMDMAFIMILWAIIGSRLMYVLINLDYYKNHFLDIFKVWQGGLVFSGGLVAVAVAMSWYLKHHHLSFWKTGDLWAPGLALGQGLGRIGCFMAGCCYGKPTDVWWGVVFSHPNSLAPLNIPIHPTQLYHALGGFIIFGVLLFIHARKKFVGQVFLWYLILHSTSRLLIERFRADERGIIPNSDMAVTQLVATVILIASVAALFFLKSRKPKEPARS